MKEQLYTIPLMDAFRANDECPFCFIERDLEQHALDFVLGSGASYMRDDIRAATDQAGFCREHYQKMFSYGNRLGSALILETHLKKLTGELKKEMKNYSSSAKPNLADRFRKNTSAVSGSNNVSIWIQQKFDYRFQDADWKNSRDSVQRAMQKIGSGYPADPPYQAK